LKKEEFPKMSLLNRKSLALLAAAGLIAVTPLALHAAQPPANAPAAETAAPAEAPAADAAAIELDPLLDGADINRGVVVFGSKGGNCVSCHGWDGNGLGKNPRSEGAAALLRESGLDAQGFIEIISCGIPGTPMPYHDAQAYKDDRCYGMTKADFEEGQLPHKGKSLKKEDIISLVAYIQTHIQGKPKATYEDCAFHFGASAEKSCAFLKK
jgi:mono/diheme cytochrome c family protein